MTHTPEPWSVQWSWDVWCGESDSPNAPLVRPVRHPRRWGREISHEEHEANAARIAACVNACAGLDTAALAAAPVGALAKVVEALEELIFRYDEVVTTPDCSCGQDDHDVTVARTALAALRGGAQ